MFCVEYIFLVERAVVGLNQVGSLPQELQIVIQSLPGDDYCRMHLFCSAGIVTCFVVVWLAQL